MLSLPMVLGLLGVDPCWANGLREVADPTAESEVDQGSSYVYLRGTDSNGIMRFARIRRSPQRVRVFDTTVAYDGNQVFRCRDALSAKCLQLRGHRAQESTQDNFRAARYAEQLDYYLVELSKAARRDRRPESVYSEEARNKAIAFVASEFLVDKKQADQLKTVEDAILAYAKQMASGKKPWEALSSRTKLNLLRDAKSTVALLLKQAQAGRPFRYNEPDQRMALYQNPEFYVSEELDLLKQVCKSAAYRLREQHVEHDSSLARFRAKVLHRYSLEKSLVAEMDRLAQKLVEVQNLPHRHALTHSMNGEMRELDQVITEVSDADRKPSPTAQALGGYYAPEKPAPHAVAIVNDGVRTF